MTANTSSVPAKALIDNPDEGSLKKADETGIKEKNGTGDQALTEPRSDKEFPFLIYPMDEGVWPPPPFFRKPSPTMPLTYYVFNSCEGHAYELLSSNPDVSIMGWFGKKFARGVSQMIGIGVDFGILTLLSTEAPILMSAYGVILQDRFTRLLPLLQLYLFKVFDLELIMIEQKPYLRGKDCTSEINLQLDDMTMTDPMLRMDMYNRPKRNKNDRELFTCSKEFFRRLWQETPGENQITVNDMVELLSATKSKQ